MQKTKFIINFVVIRCCFSNSECCYQNIMKMGKTCNNNLDNNRVASESKGKVNKFRVNKFRVSKCRVNREGTSNFCSRILPSSLLWYSRFRTSRSSRTSTCRNQCNKMGPSNSHKMLK